MILQCLDLNQLPVKENMRQLSYLLARLHMLLRLTVLVPVCLPA